MGHEAGTPPRTFLTRIAWAFFGAFSVFALTSFLSFHLERQLNLRVNGMLRAGMAWTQLAETTERIEAALEKCLVVGDERSRAAYASLARQLRAGALALAGEPSLHRDPMAGEDARGMVETLLAHGTAVLEAQADRDFVRGNEMFRSFGAAGEYLRGRIHTAVVDLLRRESGDYRLVSARLDRIGRMALSLVLGGLVLALLVMAMLSYRLTRPLAELADAAQRISRGDFTREVPVREHDEIGRVAMAFNGMSRSLARLIRDLREKSAVEVRLKEREVENLAMQNRLQEAQLQILQSQIHPHFFFNTLNTGVHLANLENAERTAVFFETVGRLFRYTLRNPGVAVALEEELNHVDDYVALLHMRFGEAAFSYHTEVEPEMLDILVPRLTLQPLVENACLHGLSGFDGGRLTVRAYKEGTHIIIDVADDGAGISAAAIQRALGFRAGGERGAGQGGLANVVARLRLWTGEERPVAISGRPGGGTVVRLCLPYQD